MPVGLLLSLLTFFIARWFGGPSRVLGLVDVFAAVEAGGHVAAGVDDGPVLVLMLARRHLTVAVAVALDRGVVLAGLRLGGFVRSGLMMASSENAS